MLIILEQHSRVRVSTLKSKYLNLQSVTWFDLALNVNLKVILFVQNLTVFFSFLWNYSVHVGFYIDLGSKTEWSPAAVPRTPVQTFHVRGRDPTAEGSGATAQGPELPAQSSKRWHSSTVFILSSSLLEILKYYKWSGQIVHVFDG